MLSVRYLCRIKGNSPSWRKSSAPVDPKLFIKEIDGLRFLAILTVFMLHLNNYVSRSVGRNFNAGISDFFHGTGLSTGSGSGSRSFLPSAVS